MWEAGPGPAQSKAGQTSGEEEQRRWLEPGRPGANPQLPLRERQCSVPQFPHKTHLWPDCLAERRESTLSTERSRLRSTRVLSQRSLITSFPSRCLPTSRRSRPRLRQRFCSHWLGTPRVTPWLLASAFPVWSLAPITATAGPSGRGVRQDESFEPGAVRGLLADG